MINKFVLVVSKDGNRLLEYVNEHWDEENKETIIRAKFIPDWGSVRHWLPVNDAINALGLYTEDTDE